MENIKQTLDQPVVSATTTVNLLLFRATSCPYHTQFLRLVFPLTGRETMICQIFSSPHFHDVVEGFHFSPTHWQNRGSLFIVLVTTPLLT